MPNFGSTPEALLGRNDSKKPDTTCKGITSSGRPCRRALASPLSRKPLALGGVVAIVQADGEENEAGFYCWQHKDQAVRKVENGQRENGGRNWKRRSTDLFPLKERSSIDTMLQRLGLGLDPVPETSKKERSTTRTEKRRRSRATEAPDYAPRPTLTETDAHLARQYDYPHRPARRKAKKQSGFWTKLCCIAEQDDDYSAASPTAPSRLTEPRRPSSTAVPSRRPLSSTPARPASMQNRKDSNRQTADLMSYLPQHLSPQTTSALLAELIKPISPHDEEGYIYIFWLTPQSKTAPAESTARSLVVTDRPSNARRISDVMTEYSFDDDVGGGQSGGERGRKGKKTIMLKIGRANNVTRRMNEWHRQCGYALNLVRWYPHVPSSATPSPQASLDRQSRQSLYPDLSRPPDGRRESDRRGSTQSELVRKLPFAKRVERLIHLELQDQQVKKQCEACGKEHREWFKVEASQSGVMAVDECVRRWVGWAERQARA